MKGRLDIINLELKGVGLVILPKGVYKVVIKSFEEDQKPLIIISIVFKIDE